MDPLFTDRIAAYYNDEEVFNINEVLVKIRILAKVQIDGSDNLRVSDKLGLRLHFHGREWPPNNQKSFHHLNLLKNSDYY